MFFFSFFNVPFSVNKLVKQTCLSFEHHFFSLTFHSETIGTFRVSLSQVSDLNEKLTTCAEVQRSCNLTRTMSNPITTREAEDTETQDIK